MRYLRSTFIIVIQHYISFLFEVLRLDYGIFLCPYLAKLVLIILTKFDISLFELFNLSYWVSFCIYKSLILMTKF